MGRYLAGRIAEMLPVLLMVSVVTFGMIHLVPGDPAQVALGPRASPATVEALRDQLGLDRPLPSQYWDFLSGALQLDFGTSVRTKEDVGELIGRRATPSLLLVGYTIVLSLLIAVPLALLAAIRRGSWLDQAIRFFSTLAFATPSFWLGLLLVLVVSLELGLLPTSGYGDTFPQHLESLTLPAITGGLIVSQMLLRQLRSSVIETMQTEYVEAARVRGLSERRVIGKHVMRNSVTSSITLVGIFAGILFSLTVVVENIFGIPGLGSLLVSSVAERDFPVVQTLTLLFALATLLASIVADVVLALVDPRVRL